jgi:hypothetical protein
LRRFFSKRNYLGRRGRLQQKFFRNIKTTYQAC